MSDEDLRDIGFTPNAVGQLRSIVKSQTTNGLNQIPADKKLDNTSNTAHPVAESIENEVRLILIALFERGVNLITHITKDRNFTTYIFYYKFLYKSEL